MNKKLAELIKNNEKHIDILKNEKTLDAITAIKELLIDKFLERGDIRLLIMDSIKEEPKHGYQIMQSISERFLELYKPSPGVIYPTLQSLNEEGLVKCEDDCKRKEYWLTKKGEKYLKKNKKRISEIVTEFETACAGDPRHMKNMNAIMATWIELAYNVFFRSKSNWENKDSEKKMGKVDEILRKASKEVESVW
jgi:DNA-binding PadR family transcriptional regulator